MQAQREKDQRASERLQHATAMAEAVSTIRRHAWCSTGILNGDVCCAASCGQCGSQCLPRNRQSRRRRYTCSPQANTSFISELVHCSSLKGGWLRCCEAAIRGVGGVCLKPTDIGCIVDAEKAARHAAAQIVADARSAEDGQVVVRASMQKAASARPSDGERVVMIRGKVERVTWAIREREGESMEHRSSGALGQAGAERNQSARGRARIPIFSVVTDLTSERVTAFRKTLQANNLEFHPLGVNKSWHGFGAVPLLYANAASQLQPGQLAVMTDATDMFAQANERQLAAAFERAAEGRPLVLSLETGCPTGRCTTVQDAEAEVAGIPQLNHINGGFVIGRVWALRLLWQYAANHSCCVRHIGWWSRFAGKPSAQLGIGRFVATHPELVSFDRRQRLCAVVIQQQVDELHTFYEFATVNKTSDDGTQRLSRVLRNQHTRTVPCFVHFPGTPKPGTHTFNVHRSDKDLDQRVLRSFAEVSDALTPVDILL